MSTRNRYPLVVVLSFALVASSVQSAAYGSVISAQQYAHSVDREATMARIDAVLAREEVRRELERFGVDAASAGERVAALSDEELVSLATRLDSLPAGGSVVGVIGIVFIVLLILELVGVIDIFKRI
jgi:Na+-transporting NADH:ubiquinone oxidoreductase subunit NqrC